jgi:hypothetical protein
MKGSPEGWMLGIREILEQGNKIRPVRSQELEAIVGYMRSVISMVYFSAASESWAGSIFHVSAFHDRRFRARTLLQPFFTLRDTLPRTSWTLRTIPSIQSW